MIQTTLLIQVVHLIGQCLLNHLSPSLLDGTVIRNSLIHGGHFRG
jgi:hypothetical protein